MHTEVWRIKFHMEPGTGEKMFTCERCGISSSDGFIMLDGTWLCTARAMRTDNVDQNSLSAVTQAKTVQEKINAWRNCNGIQTSPLREFVTALICSDHPKHLGPWHSPRAVHRITHSLR
jgi:hypothetical protein